jgi:hypothetical protein
MHTKGGLYMKKIMRVILILLLAAAISGLLVAYSREEKQYGGVFISNCGGMSAGYLY